MISQIAYCMHIHNITKANREQNENEEGNSKHIKIARHVFKEESPSTRAKKTLNKHHHRKISLDE